MAPQICPHCGAVVPPDAEACPECGSCEETGWSEEARDEPLDLPDDSFDYDDFVKQEFGEGGVRRSRGLRWWWILALVLAALAVLGLLV